MNKREAGKEARRRWGVQGFAERRPGVGFVVGSGKRDNSFGESTIGYAEAFLDAEQNERDWHHGRSQDGVAS